MPGGICVRRNANKYWCFRNQDSDILAQAVVNLLTTCVDLYCVAMVAVCCASYRRGPSYRQLRELLAASTISPHARGDNGTLPLVIFWRRRGDAAVQVSAPVMLTGEAGNQKLIRGRPRCR